MSLKEELIAIAQEVTVAEGVQLYWLDYKRAGGKSILSIFIDKEGGVTLDDCERVSRALEPGFDAKIDHSYELMVSSPGIERSLYTEEHFNKAIGKTIQVKTYRPINGTKVFVGKLKDVINGDNLVLETPGATLLIPLVQVAQAKVKVKIESFPD